MTRRPLHLRAYHALLRLFPADFRRAFGDDMSADFADQHAGVSPKGRPAIAALWINTLGDVFRRAPAEHLDVLRQDVVYALRVFRRRPAFTATIVLTLAVGVGLNTAVFSIVHAVLLRPLAAPGAGRLVQIYNVSPPLHTDDSVSPADFAEWASHTKTLASLALINGAFSTWTDAGDPEQINGMAVGEGFFETIGRAPMLGRLFHQEDYAPLAAVYTLSIHEQIRAHVGPGIVILGNDLWRRRFGASTDVIGRRVRLNGDTVEIVGVLPPDFPFTEYWSHAEYWIPMVPDSRMRAGYLTALGRLSDASTLQQAQAELESLEAAIAVAHPETDKGHSVHLVPLLTAETSSVAQRLWFLLGAAVSVLVIACANVAVLLLMHAGGRRTERSTRLALGATRARLTRQILTETGLLCFAGGVAGVLLASWALPAIVAAAPPDVPRLREIVLDRSLLVAAAALTAAVAAICGLGVSHGSDRVSPWRTMAKIGADGSRGKNRLRQSLTVAQVALAMTLVIATGLLVRTLRAVSAQELGLQTHGVLSIGYSLDHKTLGSRDTISAFESGFVNRIRQLPGVAAAGIGSPPLGGGGANDVITLPPDNTRIGIPVNVVSPGYLDALQMPLLRGRFIRETDSASAPLVVLVNTSAARRLWNGADPIGRAIICEKRTYEVVGLVGDIRGDLEAPPGAQLYFPHQQSPGISPNNLLIRTNGDPREQLPAVRAILRQMAPDQALARITTMDERVDAMLAPRKFILGLTGVFAVLAFGLAILGVYGVVAESAAQRVPEIGIRVALGATPAAVRRLVLTEGGRLILIGIVLGTMGAFAARHAMATLVFGVTTSDPSTYAVAAVLLATATIVACLLPARRAARIDPVVALRTE